MNVIMDPEIQRILEEAKRLPPLRRAALAVSILESLEESSDPEVENAWDTEANRRLEELKSGRAHDIPWDEARDLILGESCPPAG
jgi:putative addiction module component (TIGR02574 family)